VTHHQNCEALLQKEQPKPRPKTNPNYKGARPHNLETFRCSNPAKTTRIDDHGVARQVCGVHARAASPRFHERTVADRMTVRVEIDAQARR
jgi:hypothetical protein